MIDMSAPAAVAAGRGIESGGQGIVFAGKGIERAGRALESIGHSAVPAGLGIGAAGLGIATLAFAQALKIVQVENLGARTRVAGYIALGYSGILYGIRYIHKYYSMSRGETARLSGETALIGIGAGTGYYGEGSKDDKELKGTQ